MTYLFLYTELADYTLACLRGLKKISPDCSIYVIHYPVNPEAPFKFDFTSVGMFREINQFGSYKDFASFVKELEPDKLICSGWSNRWYMRMCTSLRKKSVNILTADNHWEGNLKQQLMRVIGRLFLTRVFSYIWVPGSAQMVYATKMGFRERQIKTGFYCCDLERFAQIGENTRSAKLHHFPRRLLCVARYIPAKNYALLWETFIQWQEEYPNDWELWCAGTGEGYESRRLHPKIVHLGFIQKEALSAIIEQTGVFVLFSNFEPWGVVVQEYAAAGFPLILSSRVGAAEKFLQNGVNGWSIDPTNKTFLLSCFRSLENIDNHQLLSMADSSRGLGLMHSPEIWAQILIDM